MYISAADRGNRNDFMSGPETMGTAPILNR
jgi:hypothetical protein